MQAEQRRDALFQGVAWGVVVFVLTLLFPTHKPGAPLDGGEMALGSLLGGVIAGLGAFMVNRPSGGSDRRLEGTTDQVDVFKVWPQSPVAMSDQPQPHGRRPMRHWRTPVIATMVLISLAAMAWLLVELLVDGTASQMLLNAIVVCLGIWALASIR